MKKTQPTTNSAPLLKAASEEDDFHPTRVPCHPHVQSQARTAAGQALVQNRTKAPPPPSPTPESVSECAQSLGKGAAPSLTKTNNDAL